MKLYFDKDRKGREICVIEDARIFWTNFSGKPDRYNSAGHRHFCLAIPEDAAEDMKASGWNVKYTKPKNDNYSPEPYIDVNISWAYKKPSVAFITSRGETIIEEDEIDILDTAEIEKINMALDLSYRTKDDGSTGIKGYVRTMDVTLYEDPVRRRRAERTVEEESDEVPFR